MKFKIYKRRMKEIIRLIEGDPLPETPKARRLIRLAKLVERYENLRWPYMTHVVRGRIIGTPMEKFLDPDKPAPK